MTTLPLIQDCVLIAIGTIGFDVTGEAVLAGNLTDAATAINVNADAIAYVLADEGNTYSGVGSVEPLASDRAAWNALNYSTRHTNDIDDSPAAIHHTIGVNADQAAAGNHTHTTTTGHVIEDEGMPLTQRASLNFVGANIAATDDAGNDATVVTVTESAGVDIASDSANITAVNFLEDGKPTAPAASHRIIYAKSTGIYAEDSAGNEVGPFGAGHAIQDEGVALPAELNLNFTGNLVTASDNAGSSRTDVTIQASIPISVYNETQSADGISLTYYLANFAAPSTIRVYIDGIRQPASDDVAPTDTVVFSVAPDLGAVLLFDYEMDVI